MTTGLASRTSAAAIVVALACLVSVAQAQTVAMRRAYLDPATPVSDDPRRVPIKPGPRGPEGSVVIRGGRVFDGTGAPARFATLVLERNHIRAILEPDSVDWPADARLIDATGMTVMPGLIDLHTHLSRSEVDDFGTETSDAALTLGAVEKLRYYLESGITSVRDMASRADIPFRLKEAVARNRIAGPRIFAVGQLITGQGGHGTDGTPDEVVRQTGEIRVAAGPEDWRLAVREQFHKGADVIKLASHYTAEEIAAAVDEAHALGLKVAVDAETFYIARAVDAGADVIEHPLPRSDDTIRLMARKGIAADPTLIPYIIIFDQNGGYFDAASRRFTFSKEADLQMLKRLRLAGVTCGVGTDLVGDWFRYLPAAYLEELRQFVAAGWSVPQALSAATKTNAEILDMGDRLGTLTPGKLADVLVVSGSPDRNLDDLRNVQYVIRDGYVVLDQGRIVIRRHESRNDWATSKPLEHF